MIISASRRTDIPAHYADWFFHRIHEGFVLTRNPMRFHQVSRVSLSPEAVDGIVFWTKNPIPMLNRLNLLAPFPFYFQLTLTSYGRDLEPNVPSKNNEIIPAFARLADVIGPERVIWRYDPILRNAAYNEEYHLEYFFQIARRLAGYTHKCIISFVDDYQGAGTRLQGHNLLSLDEDTQWKLAASLSKTARSFDIAMETCAEKIDLSALGIRHAKCIDGRLLDSIRGYPVKAAKDNNQRLHCGCDASVDIGSYNTCKNGCLYCYANHASGLIAKAIREHDPQSPLLTGQIGPDDVAKDRT